MCWQRAPQNEKELSGTSQALFLSFWKWNALQHTNSANPIPTEHKTQGRLLAGFPTAVEIDEKKNHRQLFWFWWTSSPQILFLASCLHVRLILHMRVNICLISLMMEIVVQSAWTDVFMEYNDGLCYSMCTGSCSLGLPPCEGWICFTKGRQWGWQLKTGVMEGYFQPETKQLWN